MAIAEVIKFDGPPDVYAWKHPSQELGTWTQLIVNESQEAILLKGGQALDLFTAGRHTLSTNNVPGLTKLINLPFGGKSPFTAEVWYINKIHSLDIKWGTRDPIQLQDPQYKVFVPVRSFGQFGIQIEDSRKFLVKIVGTLPTFTKDTLCEYFRGALITKIKDLISSYLVRKKISIMEINAYLDEMSEDVKQRLIPVFGEFGIKIVNFFINSVSVPEDDPAVQKLKAALAKRAEMDIVGYNYQQERSFDTMQTAAGNEGGGGGGNLMNAGIGLGMGLGMGAGMGHAMGQMTQQINTNQTQECPKCKASNPAGTKFCASCGQPMVVNNGGAAQIPCAKCSAMIPSTSKFCPSCGSPVISACPKCKTELKPGAKFCPECGERLV